ncbi:uncharacterized protein A1O9_05678 [Exophiala aquamarina CBS 119918]|uniref:Atos-like conserved domain-containing protein n=1 Tax=Exophiala aquamarina CBS 119918 TaxID=1182545 RepID=A0A072PEV1_9EURO|nr:uncharacterized protein A1O9_05678 [Exophiala aquamarina CBS 119918]KEF57758.1 hypothetical protein A1O9_05678 [Exophiala aquamarina CBS 119918]
MPFALGFDSLPIHPTKRRKLSHLPDMTRDHRQAPAPAYVSKEGQHYRPDHDLDIRTSDREELIQCIKRGQRPTWVPKPGLEALCAETNAEQNSSASASACGSASASKRVIPHTPEKSPLPPPTSLSGTDALRRSLSALHTGDFHDPNLPNDLRPSSISPSDRDFYHSDYNSSSAYVWSPTYLHSYSPPATRSLHTDPLGRPRAPSLGSSLSSTFVMRVPTSPLVHAMNNPSLDFSPRERSSEVNKNVRRRTMPPNAFDTFGMSPIDDVLPDLAHISPQTQPPNDASSSSQRHKPRRSLSSFTYQPASSPLTSFSARSRRPSLASDLSPRQRAPMVGSFEESILRGRMSTPPSKPLDFVAQIGVVGKGNCPSSLKCPAHVTIQFPAVFYNYPSANQSRSVYDDNPSPYVGTIDLEHNLKPAELQPRRSRRTQATLDTEALAAELTSPENTHIGRALVCEVRDKPPSTPTVKVPHGGVYRVPQAGQLQIIIKNPNKTAVKLFLVPYDLEGMLPGTKTFVRQRSFSSGPTLETTLSDKQPACTVHDAANGKDILRYLIHLKFCCTSKGRFYLYENIRVVFAHRVPDDKEKLRNEVQLPEPKFSTYKPSLEGGSPSPSIGEKMSSQPNDRVAENSKTEERLDAEPSNSGRKPHHEFHTPPGTIPEHQDSNGTGDHHPDDLPVGTHRPVSPIPGFLPSTSSRNSPVPWAAASRTSPVVEAGDGLISRKLRELSGQLQR